MNSVSMQVVPDSEPLQDQLDLGLAKILPPERKIYMRRSLNCKITMDWARRAIVLRPQPVPLGAILPAE